MEREGGVVIGFELSRVPSKEEKKLLMALIREYGKEQGWKIRSLKVTTYLLLDASSS